MNMNIAMNTGFQTLSLCLFVVQKMAILTTKKGLLQKQKFNAWWLNVRVVRHFYFVNIGEYASGQSKERWILVVLDLGAHVVFTTSLVRIQPPLPIYGGVGIEAIAAGCKPVTFKKHRRFESFLPHQYGAIDKWFKSSPFQGGVTGSNPVSITNNMALWSSGQDTALSRQ